MSVQEIKVQDLEVGCFVEEKTKWIAETVGDGLAVNALSGGVDSSHSGAASPKGRRARGLVDGGTDAASINGRASAGALLAPRAPVVRDAAGLP